MNDMEILHLTDLHVKAPTTRYSTFLDKLSELLNGIEKEIVYVPDNSVVVTVTG